MSKADEMFEKLGYKKEENQFSTSYKKDNYEICFTKKIVRTVIYGNIEGMQHQYPKKIYMQELQAINEKVKELGWEE